MTDAPATDLRAEDWRRIDDLFEECLAQPTSARRGYLDQVAADQPAVREAVAHLITADEHAQGFLDDAAGATTLWSEAEPAFHQTSGRVGPYKLLRRIGHGGMGDVYLAHRADGEFERLVAVKLIRHGLEGEDEVRRFKRERQTLALLEHPHIARMYDGGTLDNGIPYLVMEYVHGQPIDRFCDQHRLTVRQRLGLFLRVCSAVSLAHQNLIVHRDVKPSNVLVDQDGAPKLVDFGISKLLGHDPEPGSVASGAGPRSMTPRYASPEQIRGAPITTSTDVYSMGVLLYELLTGRLPYNLPAGASQADITRAILEQRPRLPSSRVRGSLAAEGDPGQAEALARDRGTTPGRLGRRLAGDLDAILSMALGKEAAHRYPTADRLAADIERYLQDRPVLARPGTFGYRLGKSVWRHGKAWGAGAVFLIVCLVFLGTFLHQAEQTALERDRSDQVTQFLIDTFATSNPAAEVGSSVTARQVLETGARRIGLELADQPNLRARMLDAMGMAYHHLGLRSEAESLIAEGLEVQRGLARDDGRLVVSLQHLAQVKSLEGSFEEAGELLDEALGLLEDEGKTTSLEGADVLTERGMNFWRLGRLDEAADELGKALAIRQEKLGLEHAKVAETLSNLGSLALARGDLGAARPLLEEALRIRQAVFGDTHPQIAASLTNLATHLFDSGEADRAEPLYAKALAMRRSFFGDEHPLVHHSLNNLARCQEALGEYAAVEELFRELLVVQTRLYGPAHPDLATTQNNLANLFFLQGRLEASRKLYESSLAMRLELFGGDNTWVNQSRYSMARVLLAQDQTAAAKALLEVALRGLETSLPAGHPALAFPRVSLAEVELREGRSEACEELAGDGLSRLRRALPDGHWRIAHAESVLVSCLLAQGRLEEAEALLDHAYPILLESRGERDPRTRAAARQLAEISRRSGSEGATR